MAIPIFTALYKTFIPETPKPVRVKAQNPLFANENQQLEDGVGSHRHWWQIGKSKHNHNDDHNNSDSETIYSIIEPNLEAADCLAASAENDAEQCASDLARSYSGSTLNVSINSQESKKKVKLEELTTETAETIIDDGQEEKPPFLDYIIRKCISLAGSVYALVLVIIIIIAWLVWGIVTNAPDNWQIVMEDGQSIQTYVWDTFLMRQQLDDAHKFLKLYGKLSSRTSTVKKLLYEVKRRKDSGECLAPDKTEAEVFEIDSSSDSDAVSEAEVVNKLSWLDKVSNIVSKGLGSLPAIVIFWIGIFIWIGCGALYSPTGNEPPFTGKYTGDNPKYGKFTDSWQMYINTAVALELLITSVFLENVRYRNSISSEQYFDSFIDYDTKLELKLRNITGFTDDNEPVVVHPCPRPGVKKYISFYAGVVGNGLGLVISAAVFGVWIGIGHIMQWNSNWWLIIGTYTGLVGFIDGFTLREIYFDITSWEEDMFGTIVESSQELLDIAGVDYCLKEQTNAPPTGTISRLNLKISKAINNVCSTTWSVFFSIAVVLGLVFLGCGLHWSPTAQLIANTPTMIIEGFFLLILIQAQEWAYSKRTRLIQELTVSRKKAFEYLDDIVI